MSSEYFVKSGWSTRKHEGAPEHSDECHVFQRESDALVHAPPCHADCPALWHARGMYDGRMSERKHVTRRMQDALAQFVRNL